jgi:tetratricopeptide (TPR) repeat protein
MLVSAAKWLSDEETAALVKKYNYNHKLPTFPPLSDLFNLDREPKQSSLAGWPSPELMAEASLFVRWGMMPVATEKDKEPTGSNQQGLTSKAHSLNDVHQRAFGQFLERSRREPVTEAVFKDCFGFGYAEMQSILGRYLVTTAQEPFALNKNSIRGWSADAPVPSAREATADEIGRIIGDWLRMHAASLPSSSSAERDAYLQAAARVLERAVKDDNDLASSVRLLSPTDAQKESEEHGAEEAANNKKVFAISPAKIHDPALVAVYGLYYFDIGDTVSAKVMLEAAVRARTPRPAAYLALAQLNFNAASASPAGENGKVSAAQLAAVLTPLFTVVQSWNLSPEGYLLIAEAWSHSATRPSLPNLQVLIKGMKCYPFHSSLHSATAKLYAQWGYWEQANETIERALKFVDAPTAEKLRAEQSTWLKNSSLK